MSTEFYEHIHFDQVLKKDYHFQYYQGDQQSRGLIITVTHHQKIVSIDEFELIGIFLNEKGLPLEEQAKKIDNQFILRLPDYLFTQQGMNTGQLTLKDDNGFILSMQPLHIEILESVLYKSEHQEVETDLTIDDIRQIKVHEAETADQLKGIDVEKELAKKIEQKDLNDLKIEIDFTPLEKELKNKVDKIQGKGLSTNDYTNQEKEKLAQLSISEGDSYDDSELRELIQQTIQSLIEIDQKIKTPVPKNAIFTDTKTIINGKTGVVTKEDIEALGISGAVKSVNQKTGVVTLNSNDIPAYQGNAGMTVHNQIQSLLSSLASKQNTLTAGDNITIRNNVISSTGGSGGSETLTWVDIPLINGVTGSLKLAKDNKGIVYLQGEIKTFPDGNNFDFTSRLPTEFQSTINWNMLVSGDPVSRSAPVKLRYSNYSRSFSLYGLTIDGNGIRSIQFNHSYFVG